MSSSVDKSDCSFFGKMRSSLQPVDTLSFATHYRLWVEGVFPISEQSHLENELDIMLAIRYSGR